MATTHIEAPAHSIDQAMGRGVKGSPFVLWEGGHRDRLEEQGAAEAETPILALALEGEALPLDFSGSLEEREPSAASRPRSLARAAVFATLCLLCALSVIIGSISENAALAGYHDALSWEPYVVASGETIRSILDARDLPPVESGRLVSWVEEMNDLPNATIYAGQRLLVPNWHG